MNTSPLFMEDELFQCDIDCGSISNKEECPDQNLVARVEELEKQLAASEELIRKTYQEMQVKDELLKKQELEQVPTPTRAMNRHTPLSKMGVCLPRQSVRDVSLIPLETPPLTPPRATNYDGLPSSTEKNPLQRTPIQMTNSGSRSSRRYSLISLSGTRGPGRHDALNGADVPDKSRVFGQGRWYSEQRQFLLEELYPTANFGHTPRDTSKVEKHDRRKSFCARQGLAAVCTTPPAQTVGHPPRSESAIRNLNMELDRAESSVDVSSHCHDSSVSVRTTTSTCADRVQEMLPGQRKHRPMKASKLKQPMVHFSRR